MFFCFDCDGTLADTFGIFREAFDDAAVNVGATPFRDDDEAYIRTLEAFNVLRFHGVREEDFIPFARKLRNGMDERRTRASLFPGIAPVLAQLRGAGHHLGVVSSNSERLVESTLGETLNLFECTITDVGLRSKADVLAKTFAAFQSWADAYYVGDEIRDARAAQEAGVRFAGVSWGYNTSASLDDAGCDIMLREPCDLLALTGARSRYEQ